MANEFSPYAGQTDYDSLLAALAMSMPRPPPTVGPIPNGLQEYFGAQAPMGNAIGGLPGSGGSWGGVPPPLPPGGVLPDPNRGGVDPFVGGGGTPRPGSVDPSQFGMPGPPKTILPPPPPPPGIFPPGPQPAPIDNTIIDPGSGGPKPYIEPYPGPGPQILPPPPPPGPLPAPIDNTIIDPGSGGPPPYIDPDTGPGPEFIPPPGGGGGGGGGGLPGPDWLTKGGSLKSMLDAGLLASHKSLPGLLSRPPPAGQLGSPPFYGSLPWGMSPFDIQALMQAQAGRAFKRKPFPWSPPGPPPAPGGGGGGGGGGGNDGGLLG